MRVRIPPSAPEGTLTAQGRSPHLWGNWGFDVMAVDIVKGSTRVYIDPKRCIANAKCTTAAPGVFALDEETGLAVIENADEATIEQLFAGARACPTQAIIIEQFGRRVYPTILTPMFGAARDNVESEAE